MYELAQKIAKKIVNDDLGARKADELKYNAYISKKGSITDIDDYENFLENIAVFTYELLGLSLDD